MLNIFNGIIGCLLLILGIIDTALIIKYYMKGEK